MAISTGAADRKTICVPFGDLELGRVIGLENGKWSIAVGLVNKAVLPK
jgi:hypothetical protein